MSDVSCILVFGLIAFVAATTTSSSLETNSPNYSESPDEVQLDTIKCKMVDTCEAFCFQQNKSTIVDPSLLNDARCASTGYHLHFVFSKTTVLRSRWFESTAMIKTITLKDVGHIVEIEPGAFNNCSFRSVSHLEIIGTNITTLRTGALNGLYNLKSLYMYENHRMTTIEENALQPLYQLEELILEKHELLSDLKNLTETLQWKYLHTLRLSKNSFRSTIKKPTFKGCAVVKLLNLSNSEIDAVGRDSFEPMDKTIEVLDLSGNRLKHLPSGLLERMIRPHVKFYLSNNLWECDCYSLELQGYELNNPSLINDAPLICETPSSVKDYYMTNVSLSECFSTTTSYQSTPYTTESATSVDWFKCINRTDSYNSDSIGLEREYQFFNIKQEGISKVSIEMNYPDSSLAMVLINDHDYEARCQYDLRRKMFFDTLNPNAGHLFCLIKKFSSTTSPKNCLPFHFNETNLNWGRDKIVIAMVCSFALAIVLGVLIGWFLICRYRRISKTKLLKYDSQRTSRTKIYDSELNSPLEYYKGSFMEAKITGASLRRSYSENSLASGKNYVIPNMIHRGDGNSYIYDIKDYIDKFPYDMLPPPLPPLNGRQERIYETIIEPPYTSSSDVAQHLYLQRKY